MRKLSACFLDRDGVVNREVDYLSDPALAELEPSIVPALQLLKKNHLPAIVVTNQSGIARGFYAESDMHAVHERLQEMLRAHGVEIAAFYHCPHHPSITGECDCRKPKPGLLLRAAEEHGIDLASSLMIGDRLSDVKAGQAAGCGANYLVKTGYGSKAAEAPEAAGVAVMPDALAAVQDFLRRRKRSFLKEFFFPRITRWFLLRLVLLIVLAFLLFRYLLIPCAIDGASMMPTSGSKGFTFCWSGAFWFRAPQRGDVVVIRYHRKLLLLKRIVGLPGDTVQFRNGDLHVNGQKRQEPYVRYKGDWNTPPVTVPEGEYYVVGDNRGMPGFQHAKGMVKRARIIGAPLWLTPSDELPRAYQPQPIERE